MSEDIRKMIDKVKNFKQPVNENNGINDFLTLSHEDIDSIVSNNEELDEYQAENAVEALINLQNVLKQNDKLILYRILDVEDESKIDIQQLGNHFTTDSNIFYDDVTMFDIGIKNNANLFLVKLSTPIRNIDIEETVDANINYPFEKEIFLEKLDGIEILSVTKFEK